MKKNNNQNNTASKEIINFEYKLLKDIDIQTVFEFYNWMHEETDEQLSEEMFLECWNKFNEVR